MYRFSIVLFFVGLLFSSRLDSKEINQSDLENIRLSATNCTGGYYRDGQLHTPEQIASALNKINGRRDLISEDEARDIYYVAKGLLLKKIVNPERASDPKRLLECAPDERGGVWLFKFLIGRSPDELKGPSNSFYWLGQAYRRGIGVRQDNERARELMLQARIMGNRKLTSSDWGNHPNDELLTVIKDSNYLPYLREASQGRRGGEAKLLLAENLITTSPNEAQRLLRDASINGYFPASRFLLESEQSGTLKKQHTHEQAVFWALLAWRSAHRPEFRHRLVETIVKLNRSGTNIPISNRSLTFEEIGGDSLIGDPNEIMLDGRRGIVQARALVSPDGKIIYVELVNSSSYQTPMGAETRKIYKPNKLTPVQPELYEGRAVYSWMMLPSIKFSRVKSK